jgi:3-phytase
MMRTTPIRAAMGTLLVFAACGAIAGSAVFETPTIPSSGDADDPAIWLNPTDPSRSLVITSAKNEGLRVYDLAGQQLQSLLPPGTVDGVKSRLNNVDVQYGLRLADGSRADVAIYTDRGQDTLRTFRINATGTPLTELTSYSRLFPAQPVSEQATGYGLALWRDQANDKLYSLVAQRHGNGIAQFEMVAQADGTVRSQQVRSWNLPTIYKGQDLNQGDFSPQSEGMVVDQQTGMLYIGQEDVGIWGIDLKTGTLGSGPLVETKTFDPSSPITADVEGLTIRYGLNGEGVLIASSQGDNTFAAFDRKGLGYLGSFSISAGNGIDAVQESDGADVTSFALPGYAGGVFITQDGYDGDDFNADATNFKYVQWSDIARDNAFLAPYAELPAGFDPRTVGAVPEPATIALMLAGLGAVGWVSKRRRGRTNTIAPRLET